MFFKIFFPSGTVLKMKAYVLFGFFATLFSFKQDAFCTQKNIHIRLKTFIKVKKFHLGFFSGNGKLGKNQNRSGKDFHLAKTVFLH